MTFVWRTKKYKMKRLLNTYRILSFAQAEREAITGKEFLNIPSPHDEDCTQAGENFSDGIFECAVYIRQLIRTYGSPPGGCEFFIIQNVRDGCTYYDVNFFYRIPIEEEEETEMISPTIVYEHSFEEELLRLLARGLDNWDGLAKKELLEGEHHLYLHPIVKMKKSA